MKIINLLKIFAFGFAFVMTVCPQTWAVGGTWDNGELGSGSWSLENGKLIISGTGEMPEYTGSDSTRLTNAPWIGYKNSITEVEVKEGITVLGKNAFRYTSVQTASLPQSLQKIAQGSLADTQLNSIDIPSNVTEIGIGAFARDKLTSLKIPDSVTYIGLGVCLECPQLKDVQLPNNPNLEMGAMIFSKSKVTSIVMPEGGIKSAKDAFQHIPGTLTVYCTQGQISAGKCNSSYLYKSPLVVTHYERVGDHYEIYNSNGEVVAKYGSLVDFGTTNYYVPKAPKEQHRIYTVEEATAAAKGNKNTFSIRYR